MVVNTKRANETVPEEYQLRFKHVADQCTQNKAWGGEGSGNHGARRENNKDWGPFCISTSKRDERGISLVNVRIENARGEKGRRTWVKNRFRDHLRRLGCLIGGNL